MCILRRQWAAAQNPAVRLVDPRLTQAHSAASRMYEDEYREITARASPPLLPLPRHWAVWYVAKLVMVPRSYGLNQVVQEVEPLEEYHEGWQRVDMGDI